MPTIDERYYQLHPKSVALSERGAELFPDGVTHDSRKAGPFRLYMDHGLGPRKWDVDGNEYVDYFGGHGALILGHCHPAVVEAVEQQIARGTHFGACHDLEIEWASLIRDMAPCAETVRFTSSGTEGTGRPKTLPSALVTLRPRIARIPAFNSGSMAGM